MFLSYLGWFLIIPLGWLLYKNFGLKMKNIELTTELKFAKEEALVKMLQPVKDSLSKLDTGMRQIEKELREETANLVKALRRPDVKGLWGELQLKRVVELAGMVNHCDFFEQQVKSGDDGRKRPDLLIRMPGDKQIVVDAKAPFEAFLEANHINDLDRKEEKLKDHARLLRQHVQHLGKRNYWQTFQPTPEFVVLFLPAEAFYMAALQYDPTLIETSAELGVIIATPTTLIGLLRAIAYGWKQDRFSKNAQEISALGHELYKRLSDMSKHWSTVGRSLASAVESYNKALGSFERRVLVTARKFQDLGAASGELDLSTPEQVDKIPRESEVDI